MALEVPARWQQLRVYRQGEEDQACGLYALVTFLVAHGLLDGEQAERGPLRALLERLPPPIALDVAHRCLTRGLDETRLRKLAVAAGAGVRIRLLGSVEEIAPGGDAAIAYLADAVFTSPHDPSTTRHDAHYVLVLEPCDGGYVVADPHPWRPPLTVVSAEALASEWGRGWALPLFV